MLYALVDETLCPQEGRRNPCGGQKPPNKNAEDVGAGIQDFHGAVAARTLQEFESRSQQDETQAEEEIFFSERVNKTEPEHDPRVGHEMLQFVGKGELHQFQRCRGQRLIDEQADRKPTHSQPHFLHAEWFHPHPTQGAEGVTPVTSLIS